MIESKSSKFRVVALYGRFIAGFRRTAICLLASLCGLILAPLTWSRPQAQTQPSGIPSIVFNYREQVNIPDYGGNIEVYQKANGAGETRTKFCFLPHPILDQQALEQSFQQLTKSLTEDQRQSASSFSLPVHWTYELQRVKDVIATALDLEYPDDHLQSFDIQSIPINAFTVYATVDGSDEIVAHLPILRNGSTDAPNQVITDFPDPVQGRITGTYAELGAFVRAPQVWAQGYVTAASLKTTALSISGSVFNSADFNNAVSGAGGLTQTLNSRASTDGVGVAIPGIAAATHTGSNGSETSSVNRYVSRHWVESALESGSAHISIREFTDANNGQSVDDVEKQLLAFALNAMTHIQARFEAQADGSYKLHCDALNSDLGTGMTLSQIAAATKGDSNFDTDMQASVDTGKIKVSDAQKLTNSGKSDISWTASGNILVPSTVDLYYATSTSFSQAVTAQYVRNEATYSSYNYIADPVSTRIDSSGVQSDIGTVVASMTRWDDQSPDFREHWVPADGRAVDPTTQYYKLVNRSRPANAAALATVKVPDLRGQFLRGLNNFDNTVSPVTTDPFDKEQGRARAAGESEGYAEKSQNLAITTLKSFKHGGDAGSGDHIPVPADSVPFQRIPVQQDPAVSYDPYETRPTNVAIYYYIRVN